MMSSMMSSMLRVRAQLLRQQPVVLRALLFDVLTARRLGGHRCVELEPQAGAARRLCLEHQHCRRAAPACVALGRRGRHRRHLPLHAPRKSRARGSGCPRPPRIHSAAEGGRLALAGREDIPEFSARGSGLGAATPPHGSGFSDLHCARGGRVAIYRTGRHPQVPGIESGVRFRHSFSNDSQFYASYPTTPTPPLPPSFYLSLSLPLPRTLSLSHPFYLCHFLPWCLLHALSFDTDSFYHFPPRLYSTGHA